MALKFNNTEITQLFYNGEERQALRLNNVGYFGKRFYLTQNSSTGVSFSLSRTSSPNQQAGTGSIGAGSSIYFGDTITISVTANANYLNPVMYVNIGDGNGTVQRTSPFTFTVSGNVTFYGTAASADSWQTVWTGSQTFTSGSFTVPGLTAGGTVQVTASATFDRYFIGDDFYDYYDSTYGSINRETMPTTIYGYSGYISLSCSGNQISFSFYEGEEYMKGYTLWEVPKTITITEVRRKSS